MPPAILTPASLVPHLKRCRYDDALLVHEYDLGRWQVAVAAFADTTHDARSACIAVLDAPDDPAEAAAAVKPFGAPVVFTCHADRIQWWKQTTALPELIDDIGRKDVREFFHQRKDELSPTSIFKAKTLRRLPHETQLTFVDAGLMPFIEREHGERLRHLIEASLRDIEQTLDRKVQGKNDIDNAIKATFWLLAAKALRDKEVPGFKTVNLDDINGVFAQVGKHYGVAEDVPPPGKVWHAATAKAAQRIASFENLRNLSTESLAHVYENALVTPEVRKALGTHSTPGALVDYIVWQLWPWIEQLPPEGRHVFEPACGHGAFLVSALRMLRQWSDVNTGKARHEYLKRHLHGIDCDSFALEVARLSLTLADVPYGNRWKLQQADMFRGTILEDGARQCGIMLANPPYERFTSDERAACSRAGIQLHAGTKACEMLRRTLPHLAEGACFGVVVPQGFLHSKEGEPVRRELLSSYELAEIGIFGDKLFQKGEHEAAVLLGRRREVRQSARSTLWFRRVRNKDVEAFKERFAFSSEEKVEVSRFLETGTIDLRVPELDAVWQYLATVPKLKSVADVGQGFSFSKAGLLHKAREHSRTEAPDAVPAILSGIRSTNIWEVPPTSLLSPKRTPVRPWRSGAYTGRPQVLVNYVRVMRDAWRLKAIYDPKGHAVPNTYSTVRPHQDGPPGLFIWALLNSPVANAYVDSHTMKRHNYDTLIGSIPLPYQWEQRVAPIVSAVQGFLSAARKTARLTLRSDDGVAAIKRKLLEMDAAVLQAYDLPPQLERQLLDRFANVPRKGVGCTFTGYYPPGFSSYLPLRLLLSEHFQRARADETDARMRPGESGHIREVLATAVSSDD